MGKKITEFTDGGTLQSGDSLLVARSGSNFKIAGATVATTTALNAAVGRISALENVGARVTAHRYWRVVVTAAQSTNNYTYMAELAMKATESGANLATGGTPLSSGDYGAGTPKSAAFDGNLDSSASKWESQQGATLSSGAVWIGYDFGRTVAIGAIDITCGTYFENERPIRGRVDYSDDGTNWVPSWEWGTITWPANIAVVTKSLLAPDPSAGLIPIKPPSATTFPTSVNGTGYDTAIRADGSMFSIWRTDTGNATSGKHSLAARLKPISGTSWTATAILKVPSFGVTGRNFRAGLMVRDSTSGKLATFTFNAQSNNSPGISAVGYDSINSDATNTFAILYGDIRHPEYVTLRVEYNGGGFIFYGSNNFGRTWITLGGPASYSGLTPDQIGVCLTMLGNFPAPNCAMDVVYYKDPDIV